MKALNNGELISFCSQLAMILHAGISVIEGIGIMKEDMPEGEGSAILESLYQKLEETGLLYEAMEGVGVFPEYVCQMTEIGERTGRLDEVMDGLAEHYEREEELTGSIKSALLYPGVMLGMMTVVVFILIIKVMPVFNRVFEQLGQGLTGVSRGIMNLGLWMSRYSVIFVVLLAAAAAAAGWVIFTQKGRERWKHFLETSRITAGISLKIACSRAADGMDLCIRSGLDLDQSLELVEKLTDHEEMQARIVKCRELMAEGMGFDEAVREGKVFSGVYGKMVSVGIRTGAVDQVMNRIARDYEEEAQQKVQRAVSAIEPTLVAVLSVLVGLILLSVMLPLMSIMSNLM